MAVACREEAVTARRQARFYEQEAQQTGSKALELAAAVTYDRAAQREVEAQQWLSSTS
jgi:hypothetical protein